jgi:hypothetical protein
MPSKTSFELIEALTLYPICIKAIVIDSLVYGSIALQNGKAFSPKFLAEERWSRS